MLAATGCGGGAGSTTPVTSTPNSGGSSTPASSVRSLSISVQAPNTTRVKSDNSNSTTITALAQDANNAAVSNAVVSFGATSGVLTAPSANTDTSGRAVISFSSGPNQVNRVATITATSGSISTNIPITVYGSTLASSINPATPLPNDGSTTALLTITSVDAGGNPIMGTPVSFTQSGGGLVSLTPATGNTDSQGKFTATVAGAAVGNVTITASAGGSTSAVTTSVTQGSVANSFGIDLVNNGAVPSNHIVPLALNTALPIEVNAPNATHVEFVSTMGTWGNGSNSIQIAVNGSGKAVGNLTSTTAGIANVQVYNPANMAQTDTLSVAVTSASAYAVTVQATPTVVPRSSGGVQGTSTIVATVTDSNGAPVGNVPVAFSILSPSGGGEYLSNVVVMTAATNQNGGVLGQAKTTFVAGSISSTQNGPYVHASVVGTNVQTGVSPSGQDVAIVIGGTAGSVSISRSSTLTSDVTNTYYLLPMTVLIADSNNNPVSGATVSLSAWPLAFNTGGPCTIDSNNGTNRGWFYSEDVNENLVLDPGEDGRRQFYPGGAIVAGGTLDNKLTPVNSDGGTVPSTVTTDVNGVATFTLVYTKTSAIHIWDRVRASTIVQGTETVGETNFVLPAISTELTATICPLPASPWAF